MCKNQPQLSDLRVQVGGLFVATLTHLLIPQVLANHSAERPEGYLDHDLLKAFYSVSGDRDNFSYKQGHEVRWVKHPHMHLTHWLLANPRQLVPAAR
jgi:hypothetical protein